MTPKRRKTRPAKVKPEALVDAVKTQSLDGRTMQARHIKRLTDGLTNSPTSAAKTLLRSIVARNTVIEKEIYNRALNSGSIFNDDGKMNPLLEKHLLKYQGSTKSALVELMRLEAGGKPDGEDLEDVFGDVFDE